MFCRRNTVTKPPKNELMSGAIMKFPDSLKRHVIPILDIFLRLLEIKPLAHLNLIYKTQSRQSANHHEEERI